MKIWRRCFYCRQWCAPFEAVMRGQMPVERMLTRDHVVPRWITRTLPAQIEATYGPPMLVLETWNKPARTLAGAVAALQLAVDENSSFVGSEMSVRMVRAALGYFDPTTI